MIIVEGMDNTGKSTLIQSLSSQLKLPMARTYRMPQSEEDITRWHNWANACPYPIILDRHPAISDLVYGPVVRNTAPHSSLRSASACRNGHYLIYCRPHWDTIARSYDEREQLDGTHGKLPQLLKAYDNLMDELDPNFIYNWENPKALPALITHLTHALERMK
jgi:hypothetical protein